VCKLSSITADPCSLFSTNLNPEQRLAVETIEGPVLILAGAGTGKDARGHLSDGQSDHEWRAREAILAVTFTNKAAEEMRNRVSRLLLRAGVPRHSRGFRRSIPFAHGSCGEKPLQPPASGLRHLPMTTTSSLP